MINWHTIDTVLLDMDGTLLDLHYDNYFWLTHLPIRFAEIHQLDVSVAKQRLKNLIEAESGSLNWYCTQYWAKQLNLNIVALKNEVTEKIAIKAFVVDFLTQMRQHNKRVALVTNAHQESYDIKMAKFDLREHFDFVAISHDYGKPKEVQGFWHDFKADFDFDPSKTLFIDDNEKVLTSAQDFGIRHLLKPSQPDSQRQASHSGQFQLFDCYSEILPKTLNTAS